MQVKLPPVQVIGVEGEVIIFSAVTGVGQNIAAALGEAQEDVPVTDQRSRTLNTGRDLITPFQTLLQMFSSPGSEELLADDGLQRDADTRGEFPKEPLRELSIQLTYRNIEVLIK